MSNNPLFIQDPSLSYDAQDFRRFLGLLIGEGVADVGGGQLLVIQRAQGANMSVDVAAGLAFIQGDTVAGQGVYQATFDATNLAIAAAPASNSRIDLIVARVSDRQVVGGATSGRSVEVLTGASAATPVAPALPNTAIALAKVTVSAGSTSITNGNITDLRSPVTSGSGAVGTSTRTLTTSQITALTGSRIGELVTNSDTSRVLFWTGTAWRPVSGVATGSSNFSGVALGATYTTSAYFIGLGFEEVQFTLLCGNAGGMQCVAVLDATRAQGIGWSPASGAPMVLFAPQSTLDVLVSQFRDTSGVARTMNVRNIRLDSDGYLRFEVQAPTPATTDVNHRINWKAR